MGNQQERSLAWLAGIIDGEGSISCQVYTLPDGRVRLTPFVCVVNSDPGILAGVREIIDGMLVGIKANLRNCGHSKSTPDKPCSTLRIDGVKGCKAVLPALIPYLRSVKRRNAEVILKFIELRTHRLCQIRDAGGHIIRAPYSRDEIELICSIRHHRLAKSSEAICQAPNVVG